MTAVSLNFGGGIRLIKPAKLHAHTKHYKHEDGRTAPDVCGNGSILLSHSGNVITRIGTHTHLHQSKRSNGHETPRDHYTVKKKVTVIGWLVGCLGLSWKIVVSEWRSVTAVSLNFGGGIRLIKPAKLHAHTKHYKHEDGRTAPDVCGNGSILLSHSGNVITRIGTHTHLHQSKRSNGHETPRDHYTVKKKVTVIGWLVGCLGFTGPFTQYFSLYRVISQRGRKKREKIAERKKCPNIPHCKRNRSLPYYYPD